MKRAIPGLALVGLLILTAVASLALNAQTPPGATRPPLVRPKAKGTERDPAVNAPEVAPGTRVPGDPGRPYLRRPRVSELAESVELREPTEQEAAATALGRIGMPAVPALIQVLRHRDPAVRKQAALVLARIGPEAFEAVPELTATLDDTDESVRKAAARALGQIGPAAAEAVPALMRSLVQPTPLPPGRR